MKKILGCLVLLLFLPVLALAEMKIISALETVPVGEIWDFKVEGDPQSDYRYTLEKDGKKLFEGEWCPYNFGSYRPREEGKYTLHVQSRYDEMAVAENASVDFQVTAPLTCVLNAHQPSGVTGLPLEFSVDTKGAVGACRYHFHVKINTEKIAVEETDEPTFSYTPFKDGEITVEVHTADQLGNIAKDSLTLSVAKGEQAGITGDKTPFYSQGGIRTFRIHTPGIWNASSEGDFFTFSHGTGNEGDAVTVLVSPGNGEHREGSITFVSGDTTMVLPIVQLSTNGIEEEAYFSQQHNTITINGENQTTWMDADGKQSFTVSASDTWKAYCEASFISVHTTDTVLTVDVAENDGQDSREALVTLSCGTANAYLHIFQPPKADGADVLKVFMPEKEGTAFTETLTAQITSSPDASVLVGSADSWKKELQFSADESVLRDGLRYWEIDIPLAGSGEQRLLFRAENEYGADQKISIPILVYGEKATLKEDSASYRPDEEGGVLFFVTTAAASRVEVLNEKEEVIGTFEFSQAEIDHCLPDDDWGRFTGWEISLPKNVIPAFVRLGDQQEAVQLLPAVPPEEFQIYSQNDGWWKDKAYRNSTLEHSGCAIFALSHALETLNFTGDAITPEALAETYAFCLLEGGTMNSTLVGHAGDDLGFRTRYDLYHNLSEIRKKLSQGAVFSFSVVQGHIAAVLGMSDDGSMFRIVDSAPSASIERMKGASIHYLNEEGMYIPVTDLSQIPGSRYYIENNAFGGLEYWLDASYVAKRGVRLIQNMKP